MDVMDMLFWLCVTRMSKKRNCVVLFKFNGKCKQGCRRAWVENLSNPLMRHYELHQPRTHTPRLQHPLGPPKGLTLCTTLVTSVTSPFHKLLSMAIFYKLKFSLFSEVLADVANESLSLVILLFCFFFQFYNFIPQQLPLLTFFLRFLVFVLSKYLLHLSNIIWSLLDHIQFWIFIYFRGLVMDFKNF